MTADFDEIYWLLEHDFRPACINNHNFYGNMYGKKCFYVRKLDPTDNRLHFNDQYVCYINKSAGHGEIIFARTIEFNSSKDWIIATGLTPKKAIQNAIDNALVNPTVQDIEELRAYRFLLNPIIWFIQNCIKYFKNK